MSHYTKLIAPIEPGSDAELKTLAFHRGTTSKLLGGLAVRQLLAAARIGSVPELPTLDPDTYGITTLWLDEADLTALEGLASSQGATVPALASLAVRQLLKQARSGALPMLPPPQPAQPRELPSWEELHFNSNRWNAELLNDPDDLPEVAPNRPARINFEKAMYTLERLDRLAIEGIDPANPRSVLDDIDRLVTVSPF